MKIKLLILIIPMMFSFLMGQTSSLSINMQDGTRQNYLLSDITKITFWYQDPSGIKYLNSHNNIPQKIILYQNYPNPFNPTTVIKYKLKKADRVKIKIFNILGKQVKVLQNGFNNAGIHQVTWDGKDTQGQRVSSGAYIYQIITQNKIISKKLIIIK